ncbi:MAG: hypothetical protein IPH07_37285 [Deltaproteobacteria bacterium]|nr:hypothetical protein [Deltaproteobacteria bacterium]MBK8713479.1 hypothetical protein [Deltaproteobacteria bacterium]MBP7288104.1 hypothetical protein [Nannocystaceae bacterium]
MVLVVAGACAEQSEPREWSTRDLIVVEPYDPYGTAREYALVDADGERRPLPIQEVESVSWALDGDVLLAHTSLGAVWGWSGHEEPPWLLHEPSVIPGLTQTLQVAPGGRYAALHNYTETVRGLGLTVLDVLERRPVGAPLACTTGPGVVWVGEGPELLEETDECGCCLMPTPFTVTHVRPGGEDDVLVAGVEVSPQIDIDPRRSLATVSSEGRWQLYELGRDDDVLVLDEPDASEYRSWSPDGKHMAQVTDQQGVVRDRRGAVVWEGELAGFSSMTWSRAGDRFVVQRSCADDLWRLELVDLTRSEPVEIVGCDDLRLVSWSPRGDALLMKVGCGDDDGALERVDLGTNERRRLIDATPCDTIGLGWSPDQTTYAAWEACEAGGARVRFFDADGEAIAAGSCDAYLDAVWSPDSDMLALTQGRFGDEGAPPHLHLLRSDGKLRDLGEGLIPLGVHNDWRPGPP